MIKCLKISVISLLENNMTIIFILYFVIFFFFILSVVNYFIFVAYSLIVSAYCSPFESDPVRFARGNAAYDCRLWVVRPRGRETAR